MTDALGADRWKEHQSAFDRVRAVALTISEPKSANWIVEQANVSENTARDHLQRLVEMNVLRVVSRETTIEYEPDPLYTRIQALRDLLDNYYLDDLLELRRDLQQQVEEWQNEYDADSPSDLREQAGHTDTAEETQRMRRTANDWDTIAYRLQLVDDTIEHYSDYAGSATPT